MAVYFRGPEKPYWMSSLEGLLESLGNAGGELGSAAIKSSQEKKARIGRKEALVKAGYPEDIANQIAQTDDQTTTQAIQQKYQQQQQQQQNYQYVNNQRMMQGLPPIPMQDMQQQQQMGQQEPLAMLNQLGPKPIPSPQEAGAERMQQQQMQQQMAQGRQSKDMSPEEYIDLAVLYGQMTPEQAEKAKSDLRRDEQKSRQRINQSEMKDIAKYREKVLSKGQAIDANLKRLDILEDLSASGELDNPKWASFLNTVGLGKVRGLQGAKTQHYNKIIADFVSGANAMFPGELTDTKLRMFLERLPTSDIDEDARTDIINDLRLFMKSDAADRDAYMELTDDNDGRPFPGIIEAASKLAAKKRAEYAQEVAVLTPELLSERKSEKEKRPSEPLSSESVLSDIPKVAGQFAKGFAEVPANIRDIVMRNATPEDFTSLEEMKKWGFKPTKEQENRFNKLKSLTNKAPKAFEKIEELTEKPKTAVGKQAGQYAETLGSMLSPVPGLQGIGLAKAATQAGVGQIAKWAAQTIGAGEGVGEGFKLGSMLLYTLLGRGGPMAEASKIYNEGKKFIPRDVKASTGPLRKIGEELEKSFDPSIMKDAKSQQIYNKMLDNFRDLTDYSKVPIVDVWDFKKKIPEMAEQASKYSSSAVRPFDQLGKELGRYLKSHPDVPEAARKAIKIGDELYTGYNNIIKTAKNAWNVVKNLKSLSAATLGLFKIPKATIGLGAAGAVGVAGKTAYTFAKELFKNPSIRHHYVKTIQLAARESKGPLIKEITLLDKAIRRNTKKEKK